MSALPLRDLSLATYIVYLALDAHRISTSIPEAQAHFDQGMMLAFGFNQPEALESFMLARGEDPQAPAPYWGIAYALGEDMCASRFCIVPCFALDCPASSWLPLVISYSVCGWESTSMSCKTSPLQAPNSTGTEEQMMVAVSTLTSFFFPFTLI